jgi:hypothetical protein
MHNDFSPKLPMEDKVFKLSSYDTCSYNSPSPHYDWIDHLLELQKTQSS